MSSKRGAKILKVGNVTSTGPIKHNFIFFVNASRNESARQI